MTETHTNPPVVALSCSCVGGAGSGPALPAGLGTAARQDGWLVARPQTGEEAPPPPPPPSAGAPSRPWRTGGGGVKVSGNKQHRGGSETKKEERRTKNCRLKESDGHLSVQYWYTPG